jgi:hypothetical protein
MHRPAFDRHIGQHDTPVFVFTKPRFGTPSLVTWASAVICMLGEAVELVVFHHLIRTVRRENARICS